MRDSCGFLEEDKIEDFIALRNGRERDGLFLKSEVCIDALSLLKKCRACHTREGLVDPEAMLSKQPDLIRTLTS